MHGRKVQAPNGAVWVVRRRWAPRLGGETLGRRMRRQLRRARVGGEGVGELGNVLDIFSGADDLGGMAVAIAVGIVVIILILLLFFVLIPLLFVLFDLLILAFLVAAGVMAKVVFKRPWTVEARPVPEGEPLTWQVVGWRASTDRRDRVAQHLEAGLTPPEGAPTIS